MSRQQQSPGNLVIPAKLVITISAKLVNPIPGELLVIPGNLLASTRSISPKRG